VKGDREEMSNKRLILVVDDEEGIRESLSGILEDEGFEVITSSSSEDALVILKQMVPDLIMLDVWLPGMDGIELLTQIKTMDINIPIIMISGHGNIELAVKATKIGAYDFLEKPLSLEKVLLVVKNALDQKNLEKENRLLKENIIRKCKLIGSSEKIKILKSQIEMASQSNSRVLILGESGTGKEIVARLLHEKSNRSNGPFVEVNCAAIPQELIESELFGHEKGAFTGASEKKEGRFELADKGTLFLDEIADMSLQTQAKMLRAIETQVFQRVGGNKNIKVDVRIIAATNKNLIEEVRKGNFREDLYYRLNVIPINVPSLRERKEDIPQLIDHFVDILSLENGIKPKKIDKEVLKTFMDYDWPGNIRELRNAVERLMIMVQGDTITIDHLNILGIFSHAGKFNGCTYFSYKTLKEGREAFEKDFILKKLQENNWNVSKTAEIIGVERSNLHKKIRSYGITEKQ
jgi:two-component system nitrogen regulation response regulator NtrX